MLFASLAKARQPGGASEVNPDSKCLINARSLSEVFRQTRLDQDDGLIPEHIR
jgi:hypothetical protein